MELPKEECENLLTILKETRSALLNKDPLKLKELSNKTVHSSCTYQNPESITTAVIIYTLSKIVEREDYRKVNSWDIFVKKFNAMLELAENALSSKNDVAFSNHLEKSRKLLSSVSPNLKPYIEEILKKAMINKGSKIYEHGLSLGKTSQLLGISQWDLSEYTGQKDISDNSYNQTIDTKRRAKMALEFFS